MSEKETEEPRVVTVQFKIGKWAVNFLKAYIDFLGMKVTVEDLCREMVYDKLCDLRDHVRGLPFYFFAGF